MAEWKIGPTFLDELKAAGAPTDDMGWNIFTGNIWFGPSISEAGVDLVNAVYAAHDPLAQTDPPTVPYPPGLAPGQLPTQQPVMPGPK